MLPAAATAFCLAEKCTYKIGFDEYDEKLTGTRHKDFAFHYICLTCCRQN